MKDPIFDLYVLSQIARRDKRRHGRPRSAAGPLYGVLAILVGMGLLVVLILGSLAAVR